jgi:Sulfotransferase domain
MPIIDAAKSANRFYRIATSPIRLMPDFIIIGVARGGTTSLYEYLIDHPNILGASRKEVHFFDTHFRRGMAWYRGQFPYSMQKYYARRIQKRDFITGEASPYYIFHPYAAQRLADALPQAKLIVLLRNPVERAFSHYCWEVGWGDEKLSFEEAVDREEERIRIDEGKLVKDYSFNHQHFSYLARGIYVEQFQNWFKLFPREQFLILKSEDMYKEPASIFKQTLDFLGVPYSEPKVVKKEFKQYNKPKYSPPNKMDPALRKRLVEYFEPYNARLYELLGRDFGWD